MIPLARIRHILVLRLDGIGDVALTSPFLRELRRILPEARITLAVRPGVRNLVELCPHIDDVITFDGGGSRGKFLLRALRFTAARLAQPRPDLSILPRWGPDYDCASWLGYLSRARYRIGFRQAIGGRGTYEAFFTHLIDESTTRHWVEYGLNLLRVMGGTVENDRLEVWIGPEDEAIVEGLLRGAEIGSKDPVIAVCPAAGSARRTWALDSFAETVNALQSEFQTPVAIIGGPEDTERCAKLRQRLRGRALDVSGRTTLRQTAALLRRCRLLISGDTGPMHLAASVGIAIAEISCHPKDGAGSHENSPAHFHPWRVRHAIVQPKHAQPPCRNGCDSTQAHCILQIPTEEVLQASRTLLQA